MGHPAPQTRLRYRQFLRDRRHRLVASTSEVHGAAPELGRVRCRHEQHPPWWTGSTSGDVSGVRGQAQAAFVALSGVAPLQASSGNTRRHRLNRGGDRRLNRALYTIALTRLGHDPRTCAYRARRAAEGATKREIIRILKRYISRELFRLLTATQTPPMTA
ncbi:IS110 family transposase [Pseudonocardia sp. EV170527-09]|nr:IS110 family transposase [Pseudonocardia sp. EV170527-09]